MIAKEIREFLLQHNPDALFIGQEEQHDSALSGIARIKRDDTWVFVPMYEYELLVDSFSKEFEDAEDPQQDAMEWIDYNVLGAYVGIHTPFIVYN